jgi:hypothetical protein
MGWSFAWVVTVQSCSCKSLEMSGLRLIQVQEDFHETLEGLQGLSSMCEMHGSFSVQLLETVPSTEQRTAGVLGGISGRQEEPIYVNRECGLKRCCLVGCSLCLGDLPVCCAQLSVFPLVPCAQK